MNKDEIKSILDGVDLEIQRKECLIEDMNKEIDTLKAKALILSNQLKECEANE